MYHYKIIIINKHIVLVKDFKVASRWRFYMIKIIDIKSKAMNRYKKNNDFCRNE